MKANKMMVTVLHHNVKQNLLHASWHVYTNVNIFFLLFIRLFTVWPFEISKKKN